MLILGYGRVFLEAWRQAWQSCLAHPLRSVLGALAIAVAVATEVLVITAVDGVENIRQNHDGPHVRQRHLPSCQRGRPWANQSARVGSQARAEFAHPPIGCTIPGAVRPGEGDLRSQRSARIRGHRGGPRFRRRARYWNVGDAGRDSRSRHRNGTILPRRRGVPSISSGFDRCRHRRYSLSRHRSSGTEDPFGRSRFFRNRGSSPPGHGGWSLPRSKCLAPSTDV